MLPKGAKLVSLDVQPKTIELTSPYGYAQLLVTGKLASGDTADVTRIVQAGPEQVDRQGLANRPGATHRPTARPNCVFSLEGATLTIPVRVSGLRSCRRRSTSFMTLLRCSRSWAATKELATARPQGKNGFKLSLRGYDPLFDVRALTDDLAGRRVNVASPDDSLMLLKASAGVPHMGGQLTKPGDVYYDILRDWIAGGGKLDPDASARRADRVRSAKPGRAADRRQAADSRPGDLCRRRSPRRHAGGLHRIGQHAKWPPPRASG